MGAISAVTCTMCSGWESCSAAGGSPPADQKERSACGPRDMDNAVQSTPSLPKAWAPTHSAAIRHTGCKMLCWMALRLSCRSAASLLMLVTFAIDSGGTAGKKSPRDSGLSRGGRSQNGGLSSGDGHLIPASRSAAVTCRGFACCCRGFAGAGGSATAAGCCSVPAVATAASGCRSAIAAPACCAFSAAVVGRSNVTCSRHRTLRNLRQVQLCPTVGESTSTIKCNNTR